MPSVHEKPPPASATPTLHVPPPINNNAWHRYSTLLAIKTLRRIRPRRGSVLMLTRKKCSKYGRGVNISEALTMRFVAQHTSIPVPKVFSAFTHSGSTYIVMERIQGDILGNGWVNRDEQSKAKLLSQLRDMVAQLRQLQPPEGGGVASIDVTSLYDGRIPGSSLRFGPFHTVQEFHQHLRRGIAFDPQFDPQFDREVQDLIKQYNKSWPLVFTHGDLSSLNILVHGDRIVGIIDWETAGWYPSYWEYTTAYQVNPQNSFWVHEIDKFLQPFPEELEMERLRQKYFGDI